MAERSPLDNRSLSHTSREPEGQAWAQIGTKAPTSSAKAPTVLPPPTANNPNPPAAQSPTRAEEDTMSDEGRPLQVVEDADPERLNEASNSSEEKKDGGDAAPNSEKPSEKPEGRDRETGVRDRTNSADPKMVRARVFVGHLNTEKCSRSELEELFSPFGKVASCSLQHGYGFVQYYEEQAAKRAITELHGLHFKGMKLVVDKTAALKKVQGENPNAPKPWATDRDDRYTSEMELRRREASLYEREYAMYERSTRLEELERMYFERYPPYPARDPYYDRYYERSLPPRDPYTESRYRPEMERGRYYDRPLMGMSSPMSFERAYYESRDRYDSYDRPRDDPYDRREKDSYREHSLRDREPFERFDSSRRL